MATFADLLSTKTLDDWKTAILNAAESVGLNTSNWAEGGFTRTLLALFTQLYKTAGDVVRIIAGSGFLDTAEGDWLKLLAKQVFNVDAIEATYASAPAGLTLTNTGGGLYIFEAGDIVAAHSSTGKTYRNASGGTLNPGVGQTLTVDLVAEEAGAASNAGVGTITVLVTTVLGVTCSNPVALVGLDAEAAPALRQRCRDAMAALALGGIKRAYDGAAKGAKRLDGTSVGVTRVSVVPPPGDGTLTVYVASVGGSLSGPDVARVQAAFDETVTPYGFDATAVSASNLSISAPCTIWIPASLGLSEADARQLVFNALEAYIETVPIGGVVISPTSGRIYWRATLGVIEGAIPGMLKAQLTVEADATVNVYECPVWAGLLAETTVVQVN